MAGSMKGVYDEYSWRDALLRLRIPEVGPSDMEPRVMIMCGIPHLDRGEILLTNENVAPGMLMPDAPKTGLGTEPADQPFGMDMNNISSSSIRDVEFCSGTEKRTWELMQSVVERGSSSKRPVDRSVPSSSNNEATNAASTPVRGIAIEQPRLDDGLRGMDILLVEEPRAAVVLMTDEPETRQRTEQAHQSFEMNTKSAPLIACKVTVGRPSFSLLEDLNYTISKSDLVTEAWFYDLMIDDASFLSRIPFTKAVFVNCQNMRILCPLTNDMALCNF
ncbi:disease resistance protein [Salix suchowensis]|nr:disease resistance protein [Salix suchowensis]